MPGQIAGSYARSFEEQKQLMPNRTLIGTFSKPQTWNLELVLGMPKSVPTPYRFSAQLETD